MSAPFEVLYLDPAAETSEILRSFRDDDNHLDLIEGLDPTAFSVDQLELLSFVVGRTYDRVEVYEVTAFSEDETPIPFFRVSSKGADYSLLRLGRGELNAAYLFWKLWDLEPGTVVLLEEPEAHLAFRSQQALIGGLVSLIVKKDIVIVTSSHTPDFFRSLPNGSATLLQALPTPSIQSSLNTLELADYLDLNPSTNTVLLVEDYVAESVLRAILNEQASPELRAACIRFAASGESGVERVLAELDTRHPSDGRVVGVLDGDQRAHAHSVGRFLPSDRSPERWLRECAHAWERGQYQTWDVSALGTRDRVRMQLDRHDGLEDHDWLVELGKTLGGLDMVVCALTRLALLDDSHRTQAEELVLSLESLIASGSAAGRT